MKKVQPAETLFTLMLLFFAYFAQSQSARPNILIITADDMNYDSPGFAGGVAPNVTPNLDRLASESLYFEQAFTIVAVCQPSRQAMLCGLIPHHYGAEGFFPMAKGIPTLPGLLREAGYVTGAVHKVGHMRPYENFNWHYTNEELGLTDPTGVVGRDPAAMASGLRTLIEAANDQQQPFFMMINSADPHRPLHGDFKASGAAQPKTPSRVYEADEVVVPPSLPDIPKIREDVAKYASSVRRLDDAVGACLQVLKELGKEENTLVVFLSDHGMPFPFAKFDTYLGSNRSPLLMRLPGKITPRVESTHLVSLMDLTPTLLDLVGIPIPQPMDGESLVPFLKNETPTSWRDAIVFIRNEDIYYAGPIKRRALNDPEFPSRLESWGWRLRSDHPTTGTYSREKEMRAYFDGKYGYIYNDWYRPDGMDVSPLGAGVPYPGPSFNAMKEAAPKNPTVRARYEFFLVREQEELYDWETDPGSTQNLAGDPAHADELAAARKALVTWMKSADDPLLSRYKEKIK